MPGKSHKRKSVIPDEARDLLVKMAESRDNLPHLSELLEHFIRFAGGPQALAKMLWDETRASPAGGVVRQRNLDMVTRMWRQVAAGTARSDDLGLISEADIERELASTIQEARRARRTA
jgi:hypothetical protein